MPSNEPTYYQQPSKASDKELARKTLEEAYSKSKSTFDFTATLRSKSCIPYYRGAEQRLTGIIFKGRKYRFQTIGFNKDRITLLDSHRSKEERDLAELRNIRSCSKELSRGRDGR